MSPAYVQQPSLLLKRAVIGGEWDVRGSKSDSDDHTLGAFVKIVFKIPKGRETGLTAALSREGKMTNRLQPLNIK